MFRSNLFVTFSLALFSLVLTSAFQPAYSSNHLDSQSNEPIAYIGHGAMFDRNGKEIQVTSEFISEAQKFYLDTLLSQVNEKQRALFKQKQKRLLSGQQWDARSEHYVNSVLIEWLIKEAKSANSDTLSGKIKLLKQKLTSPSFQADPSVNLNEVKPFELPGALKDLLFEEGLMGGGGSGPVLFSTTLGGAAYINQCNGAGVPAPPDWGTSQWVSRGVLSNEFISEGLEAEVFTYDSNTPEGMCIALPRSTGNIISLLGVICLGKSSSKACFWDNQQNKVQFNIQKGTVVPISQFAGGADLNGGTGGVCTSCHAGENPYVIHPGTALGLPVLSGLNLRADNWYDPMVHPDWPQNAGPTNILDSVPSTGQCTACHTQTGGGGRFPQLSTEIAGYCGIILPTAISRTMPPGSPNNPSYAAHINALTAGCMQSPTPSVNRWAGAVWSHTGTQCSGQSCPGWRKLDNNVRTVSIAAANSKLYQLHHDGVIWEHTDTACSGESCPGWRRIDNNPKTIAMAAGDQLYQLHNDGLIWRYTGTPCAGQSCPGWSKLDNNPRTVTIAASGDKLYQLHRDGRIWRYTGTACSGNNCPGWRLVDNNPRGIAIVATGDKLFQLHHDGRIWEHTGTACTGNSCPGWRLLDNNTRTVDISANNGQLYQRHREGLIWRYTGNPCSGQSCPGWIKLDNNPRSSSINGAVYQDHQDGRIWRATGTQCSGDSCPGWQMLDNNPRSKYSLAADNDNNKLYQLHAPKLFQLHNNGSIWQSIGQSCEGDSCGGWQRLDNNQRTKAITASGGKLYQLHDNGRIWQSTGQPCSGENCPGWIMIDNNPRTKAIVSSGGQLYQLHDNGRIWRFNGSACQDNNCPSWVMLDNNTRTEEIAAGAGQLYQRHNDGKIWLFTGATCQDNSSPGWVMLDNNSRTRKISASGGKLYQLHDNGAIWESTGGVCSGNSCPGWRMLDNNPRTIALASGGGELLSAS